jgi:hypothetical protein
MPDLHNPTKKLDKESKKVFLAKIKNKGKEQSRRLQSAIRNSANQSALNNSQSRAKNPIMNKQSQRYLNSEHKKIEQQLKRYNQILNNQKNGRSRRLRAKNQSNIKKKIEMILGKERSPLKPVKVRHHVSKSPPKIRVYGRGIQYNSHKMLKPKASASVPRRLPHLKVSSLAKGQGTRKKGAKLPRIF